MDPTMQVLIGGFACAYGLFTLVMRFVAPESRLFAKLGPMRERWGHGAGTALHVLSYTIVPIVVGVYFLAGALL